MYNGIFTNEKDIVEQAEMIREHIKRNREIIGRMRADDFGFTLKQLMQWSGVSVGLLAERALISTKTIQRMRNSPDYQAEIGTIIALCIGMQLPPPVAHRFLRLAGFQIRYSSELLVTYEFILNSYYRLGIHACNEMLQQMNFKPLTQEE